MAASNIFDIRSIADADLVREMLIHDRACRKTDDAGIKLMEKDIFALEDIALEIWHGEYLPIFTNRVNSRDGAPPHIFKNGINDYSLWDHMVEKFPYLSGVDLDGVLIAGGAVASALTNTLAFSPSHDVDLFLCGYETEEALNKRVQKLIREIGTVCQSIKRHNHRLRPGTPPSHSRDAKVKENEFNVLVIRSQHAVTLKFQSWENLPDLQIVLRKYRSPSQVLHGFDIGASQVGIWNRKMMTTSLGRFALTYGMNIFDLSRASTSYEYRLFYKYLRKGFDIIMPELKYSDLKRNDMMGDGLWVSEVVKNHIKGVLVKFNQNRDYAPPHILGIESIRFHNIGRVLAAKGEPPTNLWYGKECHSLDELEKSAIDTHFDLPTEDHINDLLRMRPVFESGKFNLQRFRKYYFNYEDELSDIFKEYAFLNKQHKAKWLVDRDCNEKLVPKGTKSIFNHIKETNEDFLTIPVNWIMDNPQSQLTGSFHPVTITSEEWYGEFYREFKLD